MTSPPKPNINVQTTPTSRSLAIRSQRQRLRSTSRSESRSRSRSNSLSRNASGEKKEGGTSDRGFSNKNSGSNSWHDNHHEGGEQVQVGVMDFDRNNKPDDTCNSQVINLCSDREETLVTLSNDSSVNNNVNVDEVSNNSDDTLKVLKNMECTEEEYGEIINKNNVECFTEETDDNKYQNDKVDELEATDAAEIKIFHDIKIDQECDESTAKIIVQSLDDANSTTIKSSEKDCDYDSSYDTRNILNDPPIHFSQIRNKDNNDSGNDPNKDENEMEIENNNESNGNNNTNNEYEIKTEFIDKLDKQLSEESLLKVHSTDEDVTIYRVSQQERITMYHSYVVDSDSEEEEEVENKSNAVNDQAAGETDSEFDEEDDIDVIQSYACLDDDDKDERFSHVGTEIVSDNAFPHSEVSLSCNDSNTGYFAEFEDQCLISETQVDEHVLSQSKEVCSNDFDNDASYAQLKYQYFEAEKETVKREDSGVQRVIFDVNSKTEQITDEKNFSFATFQNECLKDEHKLGNTKHNVIESIIQVEPSNCDEIVLPQCKEIHPNDLGNEVSFANFVGVNTVHTENERKKINDFTMNFASDLLNNPDTIVSNQNEMDNHWPVMGYDDDVKDSNSNDEKEVLVANESESSTGGSDFYFTLNKSNLHATLSSMLGSIPPPPPPPPSQRKANTPRQQVKKINPPLPPSMQKAREKSSASLKGRLFPPQMTQYSTSSIDPESIPTKLKSEASAQHPSSSDAETECNQFDRSKVSQISLNQDKFFVDEEIETHKTSCTNDVKLEEKVGLSSLDNESNVASNDDVPQALAMGNEYEAIVTEEVNVKLVQQYVISEPIKVAKVPTQCLVNPSNKDNLVVKHTGSTNDDANQLDQNPSANKMTALKLLTWIESSIMPELCGNENVDHRKQANPLQTIKHLLGHDINFNALCAHITNCVQENLKQSYSSDNQSLSSNNYKDNELFQRQQTINPFSIPTVQESSSITFASFVTFLQSLSSLTGLGLPHAISTDSIQSIMLKEDRFLDQLLDKDEILIEVLSFMYEIGSCRECENSKNNIAFIDALKDSLSKTDDIPSITEQSDRKVFRVITSAEEEEGCVTPSGNAIKRKQLCSTTKRNNQTIKPTSLASLKDYAATLSSLYCVPPEQSPSPFETTIWQSPTTLIEIMSWLGDPAVVCRMKCVNCFSNRVITENEYDIMKNAVRIGGLDSRMRPKFWLWITLEKCEKITDESLCIPGVKEQLSMTKEDISLDDFNELERRGRESEWHRIIEKDVPRAFGHMPPHKAKSHRKSNSIVRALISWGSDKLLMKAKHKNASGHIDPPGTPIRRLYVATVKPKYSFQDDSTASDINIERSDTVSDWSGISPVGSTVSSSAPTNLSTFSKDPVLSSRGLTKELKVDLQKKLETILDAIAGAHAGFGYCQGLDYVVAHLLRNLQATLSHLLQNGTLPKRIRSAYKFESLLDEEDVVVESVFRVMHTLLTTYNLQHMYWPQLRCLKTCCRIFERIIEKKLPVLADHFEYHDLRIGMFSLGWFQTLFLYVPSMPAPTINHVWDIWLVERSMKIFFRVASAILFLSQPILLNHDLEGMMQYLNTFPDATIFNPDILINCALQIKITNQMIEEIEAVVVEDNEIAHGMMR